MEALSPNRVARMVAGFMGVLAVCVLTIGARPAAQRSAPLQKQRYLSPIEMALSPDGRLLYVVCQDSDEVRVVEAKSGKVVGSVAVGHIPRGIDLPCFGRGRDVCKLP